MQQKDLKWPVRVVPSQVDGHVTLYTDRDLMLMMMSSFVHGISGVSISQQRHAVLLSDVFGPSRTWTEDSINVPRIN
jgi:hypothetical protein